MPRPGNSAPAPFIAPMDGDINQRFSAVALAINRKADVTSMPTYSGIHLISPDGSTWMVTVTTTGALMTEQLTRG